MAESIACKVVVGSVSYTVVFNSLNILQKVQTPTHCLWLEGKWGQEGELGKGLRFFRFS